MKILFCNKYNYRFSGTEVYMFELMDLLKAHGHEVALFSMADPRGLPTPYDQHFLPHIDFKDLISDGLNAPSLPLMSFIPPRPGGACAASSPHFIPMSLMSAISITISPRPSFGSSRRKASRCSIT